MADDYDDYKVGPRPPAVAHPFPQGAVRQPRRPQPKEAACAAGRCAERRKITKHEAVVHQLVNKSATAERRATKMLFDMIKDVEQKALAVRDVMAASSAETTSADGKVSRAYPELYDAIGAVAEGRDPSKVLGWWLRRNGRSVITVDKQRYRFCTGEDGRCYLEAVDQPPY